MTAQTCPPSAPASEHSLAHLNQRHQALVAKQRNAFTLRMNRSLSWLQRAQTAGDAGGDDDVAFICLWIAFNAAYAQDTAGRMDSSASERQSFRDFVGQVCRLDADTRVRQLIAGGVLRLQYKQRLSAGISIFL